MHNQYLIVIGNDQFIFTSGFGFKSFIGEQRLKYQVIALLLQYHPFFRFAIFYLTNKGWIEFNVIFLGQGKNKFSKLVNPVISLEDHFTTYQELINEVNIFSLIP